MVIVRHGERERWAGKEPSSTQTIETIDGKRGVLKAECTVLLLVTVIGFEYNTLKVGLVWFGGWDRPTDSGGGGRRLIFFFYSLSLFLSIIVL